MRFDDVISDLRSDEGGRIVLLVLDGVGDVPAAKFGYRTPLEAAKDAEPRSDRPGLRSGAPHPGSAGHYPGVGTRPPRTVRIRSLGGGGGPRRDRGPGHRPGLGARGAGGPSQLRHPRRRRIRHGSTSRPHVR